MAKLLLTLLKAWGMMRSERCFGREDPHKSPQPQLP